MEILQAFGLDIKLLIANLVNFVLLVAILYKLAYKPILKFMAERQGKIEKGVKDAEDAAEKLENASERHKHILAKSHKEAQEIISKAREQAEIQAKGIIEKTNKEASDIVVRAKKEIKEQQAQSQLEVRRDAVAVVLSLAEKLLKKKVDAKQDEEFVQDSLKELQ